MSWALQHLLQIHSGTYLGHLPFVDRAQPCGLENILCLWTHDPTESYSPQRGRADQTGHPSLGKITKQEGLLESSRWAVLPAPAVVGGPHLLARPEHLLRRGRLRVYYRGLTHHINMYIQFESLNPSRGQIPGVLKCFGRVIPSSKQRTWWELKTPCSPERMGRGKGPAGMDWRWQKPPTSFLFHQLLSKGRLFLFTHSGLQGG